MAQLAHIALWVNDLEEMKAFYERYFDAASNAKYLNNKTQFQSYFLTFTSGARLEIMKRPEIESIQKQDSSQEFMGYTHIAFSVGSEATVDELTNRLVAEGYLEIQAPRRTGDGYYESIILDPEGNRIEIAV